MLRHILDEARTRELERVYLETGSEDYFAPARRLYTRHGFSECPPFADYVLDPNSVFMELRLGEVGPRPTSERRREIRHVGQCIRPDRGAGLRSPEPDVRFGNDFDEAAK